MRKPDYAARKVRTPNMTPAHNRAIPAKTCIDGAVPRRMNAYSNAASVSKTISCPTSTVGRRWLARFQSSVPSHDAHRPNVSIMPTNGNGRAPSGNANVLPLSSTYIP